MSHMPGFGDSATWPAIGNHGDPRNDDEPKSEVEISQDLLAEVRGYLDVAEAALFKRDWSAHRLALLNAHDVLADVF